MLFRGILVALGLAVLSACGGGGNSTGGSTTNPILNLSPSSLTFTSQAVGSPSSSQPVQVSNTGTAALALTVTISGDFSQTNNCGASVVAGASCVISIAFTPTASGSRTGTLTLTDNASGSPQTVSLTGTGMTVTASVSPSSLVFANQAVSTSSAAQPVTLSNTGTGTVTITSIAASGDFSETNNCGASVSSGGSCAINVIFTPSTTGVRAGTLSIIDNATGSPQTVSLAGTGVTPTTASVSPSTLTFASQGVDTSSAAQTVLLSNTGSTTLSISSIAASGDFSQTNNCGTNVNTGGSCTINVTFTPSATGARNSTLTITDNATNGTQTVSLAGTGVAAAVTLAPSALTFASQSVGTSSAAQAVTLSNSGTVALSIGSIATTGDFSQTNNCGTSVSAGGSCNISVTFAPTTAGTRNGTLTVTDNAGGVAGSTQAVALTGTATAGTATISLSTTSLTFSTTVNIPSTQTVAVSSTSTNPLTLSSIVASPSSNFSQTNLCGGGINGIGSCTISVTFNSATVGTFTGSLTITDNAGGSPQTVSLSGTASVPPTVSASPASVNFGNQDVSVASAPQTVTLSNTGTTTLSVTSVTLTGTDPGDFSQTNNCGSSVNAGGSCTITATFTPTTTGVRTATLTITDNATNNPQTVTLTGNGTGFTYTGNLQYPLIGQTATMLNNGLVLLAGGYNEVNGQPLFASSAQLYDTSAGTFSYTGSMVTPRYAHTATLLDNGLVLIAGGEVNFSLVAIANSELYNPATGTFTQTGDLNTPRVAGTATLLPNGTVLFAGGASSQTSTSTCLATAELYDPSFGTYSYTGSMNTARCGQTATLLDNGMVLIAGGFTGYGSSGVGLTSAELYDPSTGAFTYTTSSLPQYNDTFASLLNGGSVYFPCAGSVFDPSGTFTSTAGLPCAQSLDGFFFSQLLTNGTVLILGNYGPGPTGIAYVYDPVAATVTAVGNSNAVRGDGTVTLLANGTVLVAGGEWSPGTAELYQPDTLTPPNLLSIAITPGSITLSPGGTQQFIATGTFSDGSTQQLASVTWSSSNQSVAQVSSDVTNSGVGLAIAAGTATITATAGSVSGSATLTVGP